MGPMTPGCASIRDRKSLEHPFPYIFLYKRENLQTSKPSYSRVLKESLSKASELFVQDIIHT